MLSNAQTIAAGGYAAGGPSATCATTDLLLQHPDETLATYIQNS